MQQWYAAMFVHHQYLICNVEERAVGSIHIAFSEVIALCGPVYGIVWLRVDFLMNRLAFFIQIKGS